MNEANKVLLLAYCKLDPEDLSTEDMLLLEMFYDAAVDYMEEAGVAKPTTKGRLAKYNLVIHSMVLNAWDHRDLAEMAATAENPVIRRVINQLKFSEGVSGVSNSGTSEEAVQA